MAIEKTKILTTEATDNNFVQKDFLENHNHCILCGSELELKHSISAKENEATEEANCANCCIRVRSTKHTIN